MIPKELLVLHHTHVDIGYTHPQRVVWELHDRYLDEAIDLCERTADYPEGSRMKWTCEVTNVALHWMKSSSPAKLARLRRLVENGQFGFGAMLCHWTALHPEDLLRESLQPVKILRETLGAKIGIAMQTDVNGVAWSATDALLDAGIDRLMMSINIHMGGFPLSRPKVFRWQTPAGRETTVFSGEHYNAFTREAGLRHGMPAAAAPVEIALGMMETGLNRYFERLLKKGWQHDFAVLTATHPCMDDNGPPNPRLPELVRAWNASGRAPFIRIVSLEELFGKLATIERTELPVHDGDWTDYWTSGVGASALEVGMSRRAHGALWTARALATCLPTDQRREQLAAEAVECLHQANEHTWNVFASTGALGVGGSGRIEPVPEAEQRLSKSAQCAAALSLARMVRRDALDTLAANPAQALGQEGILVFNPSELPRRVCLRLPKDLLGGDYPIVAGTKHRFDVIEDVLAETGATTWVGPVEVPPLSFVTVPLADLTSTVPDVTAINGHSIASRFWQLEFDPETGVPASLVHLASGTECFDAASGFDLFGPVQETLATPSQLAEEMRDPRASMFSATERNFDEVVHEDGNGWETDWPAIHTRPVKVNRVRVRTNVEGTHLNRWVELPGVNGELRLTISLLAHEDRVRFTAYFNKADETGPESLYFSFPFRMPAAQAHFDTAGVAVAFDREQLPGASRGWVTAESFVAVEGRDGCLTLACPDAPLFQIGGFHYGRDLREANGLNHALLLAWPTNNYWNTNFRASQPGFVRFRYELAWDPAYDPARSVKFAAAVARPVVFHPAIELAKAPAARTLIDDLPADLTAVSLKASADGSVTMVLRNHSREPREITPAFPGRSIRTIELLDSLEQITGELPVGQALTVAPRAAIALRITFHA